MHSPIEPPGLTELAPSLVEANLATATWLPVDAEPLTTTQYLVKSDPRSPCSTSRSRATPG